MSWLRGIGRDRSILQTNRGLSRRAFFSCTPLGFVFKNHNETGTASRYTDTVTASREPFDAEGMVAAHRHLPFGSNVLVQRLDTCQGVVVTIIDRGPYRFGRIIDLSPAAAEAIGLTQHKGLVKVKITRLS